MIVSGDAAMKWLFVLLLMLNAMLDMPSTADAMDSPHATSLSAVGGGYVFDGKDKLKNMHGYGFKFSYDIIGKDVSDSLAIEAGFNIVPTRSQSDDSSANSYLFRLDALYRPVADNKTPAGRRENRGAVAFAYLGKTAKGKKTPVTGNNILPKAGTDQ